MKKQGFTLVEILVVIAVLSIAGLLVLYTFTNSLRGSNKAQILSSIKKNGQAVLETMDKTVRNADYVVCVGNGPGSIVNDTLVVVQRGKYTRFRFVNTPSVNGQIQQDFPQPSPVPASDPKHSQAFLCTDPLGTDSPTAPQTLTDTNPQTGVSIKNGLFTRSRSSGFKDTVTIKFQVTYPVNVSPALVGQIDPVDFATTIELR